MTYTHVIHIDKKHSTIRLHDNDDKYSKSVVPTLLHCYSRVLYTIALLCCIITLHALFSYHTDKADTVRNVLQSQRLYVTNAVSTLWNYTRPMVESVEQHSFAVLEQTPLLQHTQTERHTLIDASETQRSKSIHTQHTNDASKCPSAQPCSFDVQPLDASLYTFETSTQSDGILVTISYADTCCTLPDVQPVTYFRVTAIGTSLVAAPAGVSISHNARSVQTVLPIVEYGYYSVAVRMMLHNVTSDIASKHYSTLDVDDSEPGVFVNRLLSYKDTNNQYSLIKFDSNTRFAADNVVAATDENIGRPTQYYNELWYGNYLIPDQVYEPHTTATHLCGSPQYEMQPGRYTNWYISTGTRFGQELTLKDAQYIPYSCVQPYSADSVTGAITNHRPDLTAPHTLLDIVTRAKWINFIGDSVTRHLFEYTCAALGGYQHEPSDEYRAAIRHCPLACSGGSATNGTDWYITYSAWWYPVYIPILERTDFKTMCAVFNGTDIEGQQKIWPSTGWPACTEQSDTIQQMQKPTLTYFAWGSHPSNVGVPEMRQYFAEYVFNKPYFTTIPTVYGLTTAVHSSLIPDKFGRQAIMRNNERISTANDVLIGMLKQQQAQGTLPTYGNNATDWVPVLDIYSPSYVAIEVTAFDAVHSEHYFKRQAVAYLTNILANAPNFKF